MDVDGSQRRMAAYLRDHQDEVAGRWSEMSGADERGVGELRAARSAG